MLAFPARLRQAGAPAWERHQPNTRKRGHIGRCIVGDFLRAAAAGGFVAASGLAAPRLSLSAETKVLRFIPQANLANLDPIWTTLYVVRNASLLFFDTLYGVDSNLVPKPQMCEGCDTSEDGLVWTFKLRAGLKFHDNEPVVRPMSSPACSAGWCATTWAR